MKELQLEMNFAPPSDGNRFRETLNSGKFMLIVETTPPGRDHELKAAGEKLAQWEKTVLAVTELPTALAVTDSPHAADGWRAAEFAQSLSEENRDRHLLYFSGKNTDMAEIDQLTGLARNAGFCNFIAVSGNAIKGETAREMRRRPCSESVEILESWRGSGFANTLFGAVSNPFQYTAYSLMPQYYKLIRKINSGAELIVTQAGWDMLKMQSLRWYLSSRNIFTPTVARLILLTPERVEKILSGQLPGVSISPDFRKILEQELQFSLNQFEAAQWRRLELQAAGCRLLGFSGIQLAGLDNSAKLHTAVERIGAALKEFTGFDHWLDEYNSYLARAEMAPFTGSFYLFDRSLSRNYPVEPPRMKEPEGESVAWDEKFRWKLRRFLFPHAEQQYAGNRRLLKHIFCGCSNCATCRLPLCEFTCPELCPKHLANGPCGGVRPDGSCEIPGVGECIHRRITRLAHWQKRDIELEDRLVPPGHKAR